MEIQIVTQLRTLASDERNRETIVRDQGCLPGLVLFLDNEDSKVVSTALEALSFLSECEANRTVMWQETGLVVSLNDILESRTAAVNEEIQQGARNILRRITPETFAPPKPVLRERNTAVSQVSTPVQTPSGNKFFRGNLNKRARTITLQIAGMDDLRCRKMVEAGLLEVKGVVSFTFDMRASRVTVRARTDVTVERLCAVIDQTDIMSAQQVVKDDAGKEVMLSFGTSPAKFSDKENLISTPDYLDEEEESFETNEKMAVARVGDEGKKGNGWFGAIGGYLSQSLYW